VQADKLNTLIKAANVPEVEPIWASLFAKALEGKDVKELLTNVGSGGGAAAAAPAAGGAAAGGAAEADAPAEEAKEEGMFRRFDFAKHDLTDHHNREGRIRRGHGLRSLRLSASVLRTALLFSTTIPRQDKQKESFIQPLLQPMHTFLSCVLKKLDLSPSSREEATCVRHLVQGI